MGTCDKAGEEGVDTVITDEDDSKTAELKRRFAEEKKKYEEMKKELAVNKKEHDKMNRDAMLELVNSEKWKSTYQNSGVDYGDYLSGAPSNKFDKDATAKDINYYSYLCGQYDTHCDPCDFKSKKKAACPDGAFCFQKKGAAQCGSCAKWGEKCQKCSLT